MKIASGQDVQPVIRSADEIVSSRFGILHTTFQPEMAEEPGCETHSCPESGPGPPLKVREHFSIIGQPSSGVVVQLVRTPACHAGGREFESRRPRHTSVKVAYYESP